jgi:DNA-binding MarR family transcriptional regulator
MSADELLDALAALRRAVRRDAARPDELSSLSGAQVELVRLLRRRPGLSVADAARELALAPNTVSTLVRQLGDAGVLERRPDPDDRRVAHLDLAPPLRQTLEAWRDRRTETVEAALASVPAADRARLDAALPALAALTAALEGRSE